MASKFSRNMENIAVGPSITTSTRDQRLSGTCYNPYSFTSTFDQWRTFSESSTRYSSNSQQGLSSEWEWTRGLKLFQVNQHRHPTLQFLPQSHQNANFSFGRMYLPRSTQHSGGTALCGAFSNDVNNAQPSSLPNSEEHTLATSNEDLQYRNELKNRPFTHTVESPFKCTSCSKSFVLQSDFVEHQCGAGPFECPKCHSRFKQRHDLEAHESIHTGEKPFKCAICGRGFRQKRSLSLHESVHTGERLFKCAICGSEFKRKSHLSLHESVHNGVRPFNCAICGKGFKQKGGLRNHGIVHTSERPFKCAICGKGFKKKGNLTEHGTVHTGVRPFKCAICGRGFKQKGGLTIHERFHIGERLFK